MTPIGPLDAEKLVEAVFLYVFRIAFTASLLKVPSYDFFFFFHNKFSFGEYVHVHSVVLKI